MEFGLSLGTNSGDRLRHMSEARKRILAGAGIAPVAQSPVYETEPIDVPTEFQGLLFLNGILIVETRLSPPQLLTLFQVIEQQIGREPNEQRNAPRPIDIDIIYAGQLQIRTPQVTIPHSRWTTRRFVVQPLCDVRPDLTLPGAPGTVAEVLAQLQDRSKVTVFAKNW